MTAASRWSSPGTAACVGGAITRRHGGWQEPHCGLVRVDHELHGGRLVPGPRLRTSDGVALRRQRLDSTSTRPSSAAWTPPSRASCARRRMCASGSDAPRRVPISIRSHLRWNGTSWTEQSTPDSLRNGLNGVACTSATNCRAVGFSWSAPAVDHWNGTAWTADTLPSGLEGTLSGISCIQHVGLHRRGNVCELGAVCAALERVEVVVHGVTDCRRSRCDRLSGGEPLSCGWRRQQRVRDVGASG